MPPGSASRRGLGMKRTVDILAKEGMAALRPKRMGGKWHGSAVSNRKAAFVRKRALVDGTFGSFSATKGGWDSSWDRVKAPRILKPPKLHKNERNRAERFDAIVQALEEQPAKIEAYKKKKEALKPPPGKYMRMPSSQSMLP
ncbi:unnamed protein product [Chrysoparadoxa australica]